MTGWTLEEIEALAAEATPGPWMLETGDAAPIGNVETADGHLILQAQQNATLRGSDYTGQNRMRKANAAFAAEVWALLAIAQGQREEIAAKDAEIAKLKNPWRRVEDELPEDKQNVGFVMLWPGNWNHERVLGGRFRKGEDYPEFSVPGLCTEASHWFPMPESPIGTKK